MAKVAAFSRKFRSILLLSALVVCLFFLFFPFPSFPRVFFFPRAFLSRSRRHIFFSLSFSVFLTISLLSLPQLGVVLLYVLAWFLVALFGAGVLSADGLASFEQEDTLAGNQTTLIEARMCACLFFSVSLPEHALPRQQALLLHCLFSLCLA